LSEIELLTQQIETANELFRPATQKFMVLLVGGLMMGIFGFTFGTIAQNVGFHGLGALGVVLLIIAFVIVYPSMGESGDEYRALVKERDELIRQSIKDMDCDTMRLDIVDKIENGQEWYYKEHYEMQKDLYYHRCEIPLRDEVMKLQ
jgi:hypothetical protein